MTDMVSLRYKHKNKRLLAWYIIPICLFLVALGIRVPNLTRLHTSPKPTPRAVLETASKTCKTVVVAKQIVAMDCFDCVPMLVAPELFPLRFLPVAYRFSYTAPPQISARAPPVFIS